MFAAAVVLATSVVGVTFGAMPASAAETADWLPFKVASGVVQIGCTWNNGCTGGYHNGTLAPAIDFITVVGTPVYAAGSGTLTGYAGCDPTNSSGCNGAAGNYVVISHADGRKSRYLHLSSIARGNGAVTRGDLIGYTGSSGDTNTPPVAHLHYDETDSGGTKIDPGPMYAVQNNQVVQYPGVLDSSYTSWTQVPAWSSKWVWSESSSSSGTVSGAQSIVMLHGDGSLSAKVGPVGSGFIQLDSGIVDVAASSNRILALHGDGTLQIKDGSIGAVWQTIATGVSPGHFAVTNDLILVQWGDTLQVKTSVGATWWPILNPIVDFKVSAGDHIAARMTDGTVNLEWGAPGTGWANMGGGIDAYSLTDDTFAVMWGGYISLKQGGPYAGWTTVMNPVVGFDISSGNHIAALMSNGHLNVLWGPIGSGWTDVDSNFDTYRITDTRVGVLRGGALSVKDGSVGATWTLVDSGISKFLMVG